MEISTRFLQRERKMPEIKAQYLVFSFMQDSVLTRKLCLYIQMFNQQFYMDEHGIGAYYPLSFLQEPFDKDITYLYDKLQRQFVRLQSRDRYLVIKEYLHYYESCAYEFVKYLAPRIYAEIVNDNISITKEFKMIFGRYLDKGILLDFSQEKIQTYEGNQIIWKKEEPAAYCENPMKFYIVEADKKSLIPRNINKNHVLDTRKVTKEKIMQLPRWNLMEAELPTEGFFPDLLSSPVLLVKENILNAIFLYDRDIAYRCIKLWDPSTGENATYFLMAPQEVDCLSEKTQYTAIGRRVVKPVLDRKKVQDLNIFRIKGYDRSCVVMSQAVIESILKRGGEGLALEEIALLP